MGRGNELARKTFVMVTFKMVMDTDWYKYLKVHEFIRLELVRSLSPILLHASTPQHSHIYLFILFIYLLILFYILLLFNFFFVKSYFSSYFRETAVMIKFNSGGENTFHSGRF